jgi:hypothetical protein
MLKDRLSLNDSKMWVGFWEFNSVFYLFKRQCMLSVIFIRCESDFINSIQSIQFICLNVNAYYQWF